MDPTLRVVLLFAGCTIGCLGLYAARSVIVPMLLALCLTLAVQPLIGALEQRRWHRGLAAAVGMVAILSGVALFLVALFYGANQLVSQWPVYEEAANELRVDLTQWLARHGFARAAVSLNASSLDKLIGAGVLSVLREVPQLFWDGMFILILAFSMIAERHTFKTKLVGKIGSSASRGERSYNQRIVHDIQQYLGVKTLVSALTGLSAGIWCELWGVPNAPLWGVVAFVLNFIPVAGSIAAAVPPLMVVALTGSLTDLIAVGAGYTLINLVFGYLLEPRWLGRACGLSSLVVLVSMTAWGTILGPAGAILSVPLTCGIRRAFKGTRDFQWLSRLIDVGVPASQRPSTLPGTGLPPTPDDAPLSARAPQSSAFR